MKFVLLVLLLSGCISKDLRALNDSDVGVSTVDVIAHRGASAYAPENTFAAFDKAQELGAVACETDIQLSKDSKLVVFHDSTLDEKTSLKGAVKDHTWAELAAIDMAPWFARTHDATTGAVKENATATLSRVETTGTAAVNPSRRANTGGVATSTKASKKSRTKRVALPTNPLTHLILLEDLLERYGMTFQYSIEIKASDEAIPALALKTIGEYGLNDNVIITSFKIDQLNRVRALDKTITIRYLIDDKKVPSIDGEIQRAQQLGFNQVSIRASLVTPAMVKRAQAAGLKTTAWGIDSDADMHHALDAGVTGITTNWPDRLMKMIRTPQSR